jgi:hypothetical protein
MNKNGMKIVIVVICLAAAGLLLAMNMGWIGGGAGGAGAQGQTGGTAPTPTDPTDFDANNPPAAGDLVKDRF